MEKPYMIWVARFRDGRILRQIDDDAKTIYFFNKDVLPFTNDLIEFWLEDEHKRIYGINLQTGDFNINGTRFSDLGISLARHVDIEYPIIGHIRPIFFRRTSRSFDISGKELAPYYVFAIGWQATVDVPILTEGEKQWHTEKRNVKHILYIHQNTGELVFG